MFIIKFWLNLSFGNDSTSTNPPKVYCKIFLETRSFLTVALNRNRMINGAQIDDPNSIFFSGSCFKTLKTVALKWTKEMKANFRKKKIVKNLVLHPLFYLPAGVNK